MPTETMPTSLLGWGCRVFEDGIQRKDRREARGVGSSRRLLTSLQTHVSFGTRDQQYGYKMIRKSFKNTKNRATKNKYLLRTEVQRSLDDTRCKGVNDSSIRIEYTCNGKSSSSLKIWAVSWSAKISEKNTVSFNQIRNRMILNSLQPTRGVRAILMNWLSSCIMLYPSFRADAANVLVFNTLTELLPTEAVFSIQLVKSEPEIFVNEETRMLEHFRYPDASTQWTVMFVDVAIQVGCHLMV